MSATRKAVNEILTEMFGEERLKSIPSEQSHFFAAIGAKNLDRVDFRCFVEEKFGVSLNQSLLVTCSLDDITEFLETILSLIHI